VRPVDLAPLSAWLGINSWFSTFGCDPSGDFWDAFGNGYQGFGFRKDAFGVVHLRGSVACATITTLAQSEPMFRLKPAFCPKAKEVFPVVTGNGGGTFAVTALEVDPIPAQDDNCEVLLGSGAITGFVSLSGIEYDARG
jgi:hypothetical protein